MSHMKARYRPIKSLPRVNKTKLAEPWLRKECRHRSHRDPVVPARWPDAFWHDKSVFEGPERWAHSSAGHHDLSNKSGLLVDAGACSDPSDCCSLCNSNDLAASRINATGALALECSCHLRAAHRPSRTYRHRGFAAPGLRLPGRSPGCSPDDFLLLLLLFLQGTLRLGAVTGQDTLLQCTFE